MEDFAALIHPAVIVFVTSCVILGILIGLSVILDVPAIAQVVDLTIAAADYEGAELLGYLAVLDNLSEWPIGPHLQKIILFGLVAPIAWALAATVENALY